MEALSSKNIVNCSHGYGLFSQRDGGVEHSVMKISYLKVRRENEHGKKRFQRCEDLYEEFRKTRVVHKSGWKNIINCHKNVKSGTICNRDAIREAIRIDQA